jgi:hypothetical protein
VKSEGSTPDFSDPTLAPSTWQPGTPQLGSFRTLRGLGVPARHLPPVAEIGFVLRIYPAATDCGGPKLGSFGADAIQGEPRHTTTAFAYMPQSTHVWLRFARFPPATAPRRQIGFVLHTSPSRYQLYLNGR